MALKQNRPKMNLGLQKSLVVKGVKRLDDGNGKNVNRSALENIGNVGFVRKNEKLENKKVVPRFEKENKQIMPVNRQKSVENETSKINTEIGAAVEHVKNKTEVEVAMEVDVDITKADACNEKVEDIDKDDEANPQLVIEYANEIYSYMRKIEKEQAVTADYMGLDKAKGKEASWHLHPKMRAVLLDWLVQVHQQFILLQETLYLTMSVMDRYFSANAHNTKRSELQLVGVTAMLIASKYEEMYCPEVADFVYITDNAYNKNQILSMEKKMLSVLDFSLGRPLPIHFLRRGSKAAFAGAFVHTLAKYIMELAMFQYDLMDTTPSLIAAASLLLAFRLAQPKAECGIAILWTHTLIHYTTYILEDVKYLTYKLANVVATAKDNKYQAVRKKYSSKKFLKIALLPQLEFADNIVKE